MKMAETGDFWGENTAQKREKKGIERMKFKIEQNQLIKVLNDVSKAVSNRTTLEILKGIYIEITPDGEAIFRTSDLEISIEKKVQVTDYEPGTVVVMAKLFGEIIRKLPNAVVEIKEMSGKVQIKCLKSNFKVVAVPADEFPRGTFNALEEQECTILNADTIKLMVSRTSFAASQDASKGIVTGVLLKTKNGLMEAVATDGYRLALRRQTVNEVPDNEVVIDAKIMSEVCKIINDSEEEEILYVNTTNQVIFGFADTKIALKLLDGKFLNYEMILPKESAIEVKANKEELMECVDRASLFSTDGRNNLVKVALEDNELIITSKSEEGDSYEKLEISKEGENLEIGFNSKYILETLKVIDDEEVKLLFNGATSPCMVKPLEGNEFEYLILPVRLQ